MYDRQAIGIDRTLSGLGNEVVHQSQERRREKECDGIVSVPPLDKSILNSGINRVALPQGDGESQGVDDVEHCHGENRGDVEPQGDVEMLFTACRKRSEEVQRKHYPNRRNADVDRPFELGILL